MGWDVERVLHMKEHTTQYERFVQVAESWI